MAVIPSYTGSIYIYTDRKDETVGDGKEQDWKIDSALMTMATENVPTADSCTRDEKLITGTDLQLQELFPRIRQYS